MTTKAVFRVDAGGEMGVGHFMRCRNLAVGLKARGWEVTFVCAALPEVLHELASKAGLVTCMIGSERASETPSGNIAHAHWLPWSQDTDARLTTDVLADSDTQWLVVDHYALDAEWEEHVKQHVKHVLVIDDLADRRHDCDVLLDQNYYQGMPERYRPYVTPETLLLLGPSYALLHDSFPRTRQKQHDRTGKSDNLLVFFGGTDTSNCTGWVLNALQVCPDVMCKIQVVTGAQHPALNEIRQLCDMKGYELFVQSSDIANLMASADIAIGAGGVTTWERCCMGLPTILISIAANQEPIAEGIASLGAVEYLGRHGDIDPSQLCQTLTDLLQTPQSLVAMAHRAQELVDGMGVNRTCDILCR
jgi:UDP-2,4-diacetamido-2,4,6-trideoxy-beta-L-altropyranose hydrolase